MHALCKNWKHSKLVLHVHVLLHISEANFQCIELKVFLHSNNTLHKLKQHQSINQNLYSTHSRSILRGAPDSGRAEKNSLEKVVELRTGTVCEVLRSIGRPFQVVGPITEKE